jgi:hypothetical protein
VPCEAKVPRDRVPVADPDVVVIVPFQLLPGFELVTVQPLELATVYEILSVVPVPMLVAVGVKVTLGSVIMVPPVAVVPPVPPPPPETTVPPAPERSSAYALFGVKRFAKEDPSEANTFPRSIFPCVAPPR